MVEFDESLDLRQAVLSADWFASHNRRDAPSWRAAHCLETALAARPRVMLWRGSLTLCATAAVPCAEARFESDTRSG